MAAVDDQHLREDRGVTFALLRRGVGRDAGGRIARPQASRLDALATTQDLSGAGDLFDDGSYACAHERTVARAERAANRASWRVEV